MPARWFRIIPAPVCQPGFINNPNAALGAPASGNAVTPFAPPYSTSQLVCIGAGGEITLQMSSPIVNNPADPYGINFILFANQFFVESSGGTGDRAVRSPGLDQRAGEF